MPMYACGLPDNWMTSVCSQEDCDAMEHGGKLVLLYRILELARELQDKVAYKFSAEITILRS